MWTQLLVFVKTLWTSQLGKLVFDALENLLQNNARKELDKLSVLAKLKAIEVEQEYGHLTGDEKRQVVLEYLKDIAAAEGLEVATATLNFLIESAVQLLDTAKKLS